jgi:hypothetical protein
MEEDLGRWNDFPCSWIGKINITRVILPIVIYNIDAIPIKIPMIVFTEIFKTLKLLWNYEIPQTFKAIMSKTIVLEVSQYFISNYTAQP